MSGAQKKTVLTLIEATRTHLCIKQIETDKMIFR